MKIDYMIIYGCHKKRILDKRLNHALNIIKENNIDKIVLTGGIGLFGNFNESQYMSNYLIEKGINKNKIIIEDKSKTTKENNINTINLLDLKNTKKHLNIILVSQKLHLIRIKKQLNRLLNNNSINFLYEVVK